MGRLQRETAPGASPAQHPTSVAHLPTLEQQMADALRRLATGEPSDPAGPARSFPAALAEAATVLWTRFLKFDAADPHWPDRDRFVVSAAAGALLHPLLHLSGHRANDLEGRHAAESDSSFVFEPGMAPPGQAFAMAVGMALAERLMAGRFGKSLVDHRTWMLAANGELLGGVSHEAASLAGHLRLQKLAVLYDDPEPAADASNEAARSEDVLKRFAAYGWAVRGVSGREVGPIEAALSYASRCRKPTLIALRAGPVDRRVAARTPPRYASGGTASDIVAARWRAAGMRGAAVRRGWLKRAARHPMRGEFHRVISGRLPGMCHAAIAAAKESIAEHRPTAPTRQASEQTAAVLLPSIPELIGASTEPDSSAIGLPVGAGRVGPGNYRARHICFGLREHGMAATMNGVALHGGLIPCAATLFGSGDALRPALRWAALAHMRVIHLLADNAHPTELMGGAGPRAGRLASLRAVPSLYVYRPADPLETAECWELALRREDGPSLLVLTGQPVPTLRTDTAVNRCARGAYVLAEAEGVRQVTLIASGAEVWVALTARERLAAEGIAAAVVSLPCWELFEQQDAAYRAHVLGATPRLGIEAAVGFGWERWLGDDGCFAGIGGSGEAGAGDDTTAAIEPGTVVAAVRHRLGG